MSVTFWVPNAPRERKIVPCDFGRGESHECRPGNRCGYCRDGVEEVWESPAPEVNLANGNARIVLDVLGCPVEDGLYGSFPVETLPEVRRRIVRALNVSQGRHERPESDTRKPGQARVFVQGLDQEGIRERLRRLDAVLAYAQANAQAVVWG